MTSFLSLFDTGVLSPPLLLWLKSFARDIGAARSSVSAPARQGLPARFASCLDFGLCLAEIFVLRSEDWCSCFWCSCYSISAEIFVLRSEDWCSCFWCSCYSISAFLGSVRSGLGLAPPQLAVRFLQSALARFEPGIEFVLRSRSDVRSSVIPARNFSLVLKVPALNPFL
jgi:hypothetical protein